eukprot:scaffold82443_cov32-Tisochrysis_lutea.AAC.1
MAPGRPLVREHEGGTAAAGGPGPEAFPNGSSQQWVVVGVAVEGGVRCGAAVLQQPSCRSMSAFALLFAVVRGCVGVAPVLTWVGGSS